MAPTDASTAQRSDADADSLDEPLQQREAQHIAGDSAEDDFSGFNSGDEEVELSQSVLFTCQIKLAVEIIDLCFDS